MLPNLTDTGDMKERNHLNKSYINKLDKSLDQLRWDDELKGFGVRVQRGRITYVVQYRAGGRQRRQTIGVHGNLTCEEARKAAKVILGDVARGADPQQERRAHKKSITVSRLCDRYLAAARGGLILGKGGKPKKPSTLATDEGRIERHIKPLLGKRFVSDLRRSDVERFLRDVTAGKTARYEPSGNLRGVTNVTGGAGTAARTCGLLGGILSFAISEGIIEQNPANGVRRPADHQRERRLSPEEFRALGRALFEEAAARKSPQAVEAIWLMALTGCRRGEVLSLQWDEVDFDKQQFRLSDTKTGVSTRPMGEPVVRRLTELSARAHPGISFVLPAERGDGHYGGLSRAWKRIVNDRAQLDDISPHTLRHSFSSVAADLGMSDSTIAELLGHSGRGVTSRYIHRMDAVLIAAATDVAAAIEGMMTMEN